jgi:hypothetical protein
MCCAGASATQPSRERKEEREGGDRWSQGYAIDAPAVAPAERSGAGLQLSAR